jgi:hypothetical protein
MKKPLKPPFSEEPKPLRVRAKEAQDLWFNTLSYQERRKLKMKRSPWGRAGGTIALGLRHGKTARNREKLKGEREARFEAEQAAYEARRTRPAPIQDRN